MQQSKGKRDWFCGCGLKEKGIKETTKEKQPTTTQTATKRNC